MASKTAHYGPLIFGSAAEMPMHKILTFQVQLGPSRSTIVMQPLVLVRRATREEYHACLRERAEMAGIPFDPSHSDNDLYFYEGRTD